MHSELDRYTVPAANHVEGCQSGHPPLDTFCHLPLDTCGGIGAILVLLGLMQGLLIKLYMRTEAKRLWASLVANTAGTSVVVFAFAVSHCQARGKSLLFFHHFTGRHKWFWMDRHGVVSAIALRASGERHRKKVLLALRCTHDMTLMDGAHRRELLPSRMYDNVPEDKSLTVCTSYTALRLSIEAEVYVRRRGGFPSAHGVVDVSRLCGSERCGLFVGGSGARPETT